MLFKGDGTARRGGLRQRGVGSDGDGVEEGGFHEHSVAGVVSGRSERSSSCRRVGMTVWIGMYWEGRGRAGLTTVGAARRSFDSFQGEAGHRFYQQGLVLRVHALPTPGQAPTNTQQTNRSHPAQGACLFDRD